MDVFCEAKQLFKCKDWNGARNALLDILENNKNNNSEINLITFEKLGDIHLKLYESVKSTPDTIDNTQQTSSHVMDSQMYYNKAMDCYENNTKQRKPTFYIKYGNLLQYHLKEYNAAESMYLQYIKSDKYNNRVYFHYANLLQIMQKYEEAKRYYLQCLEFEESKECAFIHFKFATFVYYKLLHPQNGLNHIKKCIQLEPKNEKYHFEYALMLKQQNDSNNHSTITHHFERALELTNYQSSSIIIEYAKFLIHYDNQKQKGAEFMKLASVLNQSNNQDNGDAKRIRTETETQTDDYKHGNDTNDALSDVMLNISNNIDNYEHLKYIVYDFDDVITYWNLYDSINGDFSNLFTMEEQSFVRIFGWRDRIRRLSHHFESVLSKGIKIILLFVEQSNDYKEIIMETLHKAYLNQYFHEIYAIHKHNEINHKLDYIKQLQMQQGLTEYNELLYIDGNRKVIERMRHHCFSVFIPQQGGLTLRDFENIEHNIGIETTNYASFKSSMPSSLVSVNGKIYFDIISEIVRSPYDCCIDDLGIIRWIHQHWNSEPYKDAFIEFGSKYLSLCYFSSRFDMWTAHEIVSILLEIEPVDSDLNTRKAIYLHALGQCKESEKCHKQASARRNIKAIINYGYFFIKERRLNEATQMFSKALRINPLSIKALQGMGRSLVQIGDIDHAEYFLKKAIRVDDTFDLSHYRYGVYLYECARYQEAEKVLSTTIDLWPYSDRTHYMMAVNYFALNDIKRAKYHLEQCLNLNPENDKAKSRYYRHFDTYYSSATLDAAKKHHMLNGLIRKKHSYAAQGSQKEFEIFWLDKLEMWLYEDCFQMYYKYFVDKQLNNLESLFSMYTLKLKEIGITNEEHVEIIMKAIDEHILLEHEQFKDWLSNVVVNERLLNECCDVLRHNSQPIYSLESFYRNISSQNKLNGILGASNRNIVTHMWRSYYDNVLDE